jgi:hypothetical protein
MGGSCIKKMRKASWNCYASAMETAAARGKRLSINVPPDLVRPLEALAAREDPSMSGQVVNIVRRYLQAQGDDIVRDRLARVDQGHTVPLTDEMLAALRHEIAASTPADEALARAGLGG